MLRVAPDADVEAIVALYEDASAEHLLAGSPALVIDCIDDMTTKSALLDRCVRSGIPVLSALGAGGKADACALHVGRLSEAFNDPMATSMLRRLRKQRHSDGNDVAAAAFLEGRRASAPAPAAPPLAGVPRWWEEMPHLVPVVYSSELQRVALLPLPEGTAAAELGSQPNFRVRVMPVLPPLPAAVGAALASNALCRLAGAPPMPIARPVPPLSTTYQTRLYRNFVKHEVKTRGCPPREVALTYHEVGLIACGIFRCRCALTGRRLDDPKRPNFQLVRFDPESVADAGNVLFVVQEAAERHEREGLEALPEALRRQVARSILEGLAGRRCSLFADAKRAEREG